LSPRLRVLFLCTGNSARSQIGEALLRQLARGQIDVYSAGTKPAQEVNPQATTVLERKFGIDVSPLRPKSMDEFSGQTFDVVITVCDQAAELCPVFPGAAHQLHWSFPDPALEPDAESQRRACERVANELAGRLRLWMSLPDIRRRLEQGGQ